MNFKTTLLLLVLLAGVAGGYLLLRSSGGSPTTPPGPAPSAPLVTGRTFQEIRIERGGDTLVLTRENDRWFQTQPVRFPLREDAIDALINAGLSLAPRQTFLVDDDTENTLVSQPSDNTTGLDLPVATVTFVSDTGDHTLELGRTSIAGTAYLRTSADGAVHLVDTVLHQLIPTTEAAGLWPRKLPTLRASRVSEIELRKDSRVTTLRRAEQGWTLGKDGDERADVKAAAQLAAVAQDVPVLRYIGATPKELGKYGLVEPQALLTAADPAGHRQTLRVGGRADLNGQTFYATWSDTDTASPVVFVVPGSHIAAMSIDPETLRDARVVTALPESIRGQHVNRVGRDSLEIAVLSNSGSPATGAARYAFVQPSPGYTPDPELADRWLSLLTRLQAQGFSRAPREAQAPLAVIELKLSGDRSEFVRLYADRDGRENVLLAVRENEAVAALVSREAVAPLLTPVVMLRDRVLSTTTPLGVVQLKRDDGYDFVFSPSPDGSWVLENAGQEWEAVAFDRLRRWVESPRVTEWTALSELPRGPIARLSTGPDQPAYVVNVDQNLGQRTDLPGVFRLPPEIAPLMAHEYRKRMLLPFTAEQISGVNIGRLPSIGDDPTLILGKVVVKRAEDGGFGLNDQPIENAAAAEFFKALAGLRAKRFHTPPSPQERELPVKSYAIQTVDGQTFWLLRLDNGLWKLNDRFFYLDQTTDATLTRTDVPWAPAWDTAVTP